MGAFDEIIAAHGSQAEKMGPPEAAAMFQKIASVRDPQMIGYIGPPGTTPPSLEQFYGQEAKPQRSTFESVLRFIAGGDDPMSAMMPMGMVPPAAGLVINPRNIAIIKSQMARMSEANPEAYLFADEALRYMRAKYPKLMSIPSSVVRENMPRGSEGFYNTLPANNVVINSISPTVSNSVNSVGHELTHAIVANRARAMPTYIPLDAAKTNLTQYAAQPEEVLANRGGATAESTYKKFMEMAWPGWNR